jgi:hypothetical protein
MIFQATVSGLRIFRLLSAVSDLANRLVKCPSVPSERPRKIRSGEVAKWLSPDVGGGTKVLVLTNARRIGRKKRWMAG